MASTTAARQARTHQINMKSPNPRARILPPPRLPPIPMRSRSYVARPRMHRKCIWAVRCRHPLPTVPALVTFIPNAPANQVREPSRYCQVWGPPHHMSVRTPRKGEGAHVGSLRWRKLVSRKINSLQMRPDLKSVGRRVKLPVAVHPVRASRTSGRPNIITQDDVDRRDDEHREKR